MSISGVRLFALATLALGWGGSQHALAGPLDPHFESNWESTAWSDVATPHGHIRGKIYQRFVTAQDLSFPVATLTYLQIPKHSPMETPDQVAETLRVGMGFEAWNTRRQGKAHVYESYWRKNGRFMRLYIVDDKTTFTVSNAIIRVAYGEEAVLESEVIQRGLMDVLPQPHPWLDRLLTSLESAAGVHSAWAACPPCTPSNLYACAQCNNQDISSGLSGTNQDLGAIKNGINQATANGTQAAAQANNTASTATQNGTEAAATANGHFGDAVNSANRIGDDANRNWAETNRQASRANDTLESLTDPKNAFLLGAAAAGGAVLGAAAVNLALDGLSTVAGAIVESITHAKDNAKRLEMFKKAREKIEGLRTPMADLERSIDNSLYLAALSAKFGSRAKLIAVISADSRRVDRHLEKVTAMQEMAERNEMTGTCVDELNLEVATLSRVSNNMKALLKVIDAQDYTTLCDKMKHDVETLISAEREIQAARSAVIDGHAVFIREMSDLDRESAKRIEIARTRYGDEKNAKIAQAVKDSEDKLRPLRPAYDKAFRICLDRRSPFWSNVPILGRAVTGGSRDACVKEVLASDCGDGTGRTFSEVKAQAKESVYEATRRADSDYKQNVARGPKLASDGGVNELDNRNIANWVQEISDKQTMEHLQGRRALLEMRQNDIMVACHSRW